MTDEQSRAFLVRDFRDDFKKTLRAGFVNSLVKFDFAFNPRRVFYQTRGLPSASRGRRDNRIDLKSARHGRSALSLWQVRKRFEKFTLLNVEIKTGRTHQIRVHLASINHGVVGDETYNGGRDKTIKDLIVRRAVEDLGRFFLHAERLSFTHPATSERLEFYAPIPAELKDFLALLD